MLNERLSIAPMVDWTDCHYRMLMRGITRKTVLYTEMVVDDAVINCTSMDFTVGKHRFMDPSVIQLGGHDPETLAHAAELCDQYGGYGEINLNCGCPSPRVAQRCFGAKLMLQPDTVRQIVSAMQRRVSVPVTVKCRLGVDEMDSYPELLNFIRASAAGGARKIIMHSRKCFLNGLSTKQNRDIPPLRYEVTHRLVQEFPELTFVLNGGIKSFEEAHPHLDNVSGYKYTSMRESASDNVIINMGLNPVGEAMQRFARVASKGATKEATLSQQLQVAVPVGVESSLREVTEILPAVHGIMIGRQAYNNPMMFATADSEFFGERDPCLSRRQVIDQYLDYCEWRQGPAGPKRLAHDGKTLQVTSTSILIQAMRNAICGIPSVAKFRRALNECYEKRLKGVNGVPNPCVRDVVEEALTELNDEDLDAPMGNVTAFDDVIRTTAAPTASDTVITSSITDSGRPDTTAATSSATIVTADSGVRLNIRSISNSMSSNSNANTNDTDSSSPSAGRSVRQRTDSGAGSAEQQRESAELQTTISAAAAAAADTRN